MAPTATPKLRAGWSLRNVGTAVVQQRRHHAAATPQGRSQKGTGAAKPQGSTHEQECDERHNNMHLTTEAYARATTHMLRVHTAASECMPWRSMANMPSLAITFHCCAAQAGGCRRPQAASLRKCRHICHKPSNAELLQQQQSSKHPGNAGPASHPAFL